MKRPFTWIAMAACSLTLALSPSSPAAVILVDFGSPVLLTTGNWNNVAYSGADNPFSNLGLNLIDNTGAATGFKLDTVSTLLSSNTSGADTTSTGFPSTATADSFFFTGSNTITLTLTNLDPSLQYTFSFYASRMSAGETRITQYEVVGGNHTESTQLNASDNVNTIVSLSGFAPNANNEITINVSRVSGGYGYLGVLQIETSPIPEPSTLGLLGGLTALGALRRRRR
jgi:hypothetical protein